jgi:RNA recognition motif-containing protein
MSSSANGKRSISKDCNDDDNLKPKKARVETESPSTCAEKPSTADASSCLAEETPTRTLYVSNLHHRISEPHLQKLFQRFGEIQRVNLIHRRGAGPPTVTKSGRGHSHKQKYQKSVTYSYAFVEFKTMQSANTAMNKLNDVALLGKNLIIKPAHGKSEHTNGQPSQQVVKKQQFDLQSKIESLKKTLKNRDSNQK